MRKKNKALWDKITRSLDDFEVKAGWFENTKYEDGISVAGIAAVQNYGAQITVTDKMRNYLHYLGIHLSQSKGDIIIPPRPFMDKAKARIQGQEGKQILLQELLRVFEGRQTMEQATSRLAKWLQGIIQEEIKNTTDPPLSEATIEIRNNEYASKSKNSSTKPLNSSGIMFNTVQSKVTKK